MLPTFKIPVQFGLYAILTDPVLGYERLAEILVDSQVAFIQLRMKDTPESRIASVARSLRKITDGSSSRLIINDHPHIARDCGADGVHIGQDDIDYASAKALVGPGAIVGLSTHSPAQTESACLLGPDYIGVGPVFPTPTKKNPDPVIGLDGMKRMLAAAVVPAVAIGGIDLDNLNEVLEAGARNFCMVRQINQSLEPKNVLKQALSMYNDFVVI